MNVNVSRKSKTSPITARYGSTPEPELCGEDVAASVRDNFRANFEAILEERDIVQRDFAKLIGVDPAVITFWKKGHRYPETAQLDRIVDALKIEPEELFVDPKRRRLRRAKDRLLQAAREVIEASEGVDDKG